MVNGACRSLIAGGAAIPFTAHATSPTITMPRIKAITTGSIPSFLDVILNFAESDTTSTLAAQDTWLAQMKAKGTGKMVMYGDDTWLKLFPETFDRADGTSSFFVAVSQFKTIVHSIELNISVRTLRKWTTMLPGMFRKSSSVMIGIPWCFITLDLIISDTRQDHEGMKSKSRGHLEADSKSPNMIPKQREMDGIVRQIYDAIQSHDHLKSTLLILCGDHGMNDAGNHGGSAPGETSPALVFVSPKLEAIAPQIEVPVQFQEDFQYYTTIEQSDIAPTLGALLGFPVPQNNLGVFIPDFLAFWPNSTYMGGITMVRKLTRERE